MWMIELLCVSMVFGTILGISWRLLDDWWEKGAAARLDKKVAAAEEAVSSTNKPE